MKSNIANLLFLIGIVSIMSQWSMSTTAFVVVGPHTHHHHHHHHQKKTVLAVSTTNMKKSHITMEQQSTKVVVVVDSETPTTSLQQSSSSSNIILNGAQRLIPAVVVGVALLSFPVLAQAAAATTAMEVEVAELPPPYVPVAFGLALLVGVGLLTGSLGDVMEQEALLGMQSGARAKKEIERSRSSYFKKR